MIRIRGGKIGFSGASLMLLMLGAPLHAAIKPSIETEVKLGYDTNPFLESGNDLASGYGGVSVRPKVTAASPKGQATLSGNYDRTEYFKRYGHIDQYGGALEGSYNASQALSVFGGLRYDHSVIGAGDDIVTSVPIDNTDINLLGTRTQVNTYAASAGFGLKVSPRDTISVDGGYTATRYEDRPAGSNNDNYGGRVAYTHAISSRTKIGVSGSVYKIDYDISGLSTLVMQPNVTFSTELSPTWHFDAALGMSFTTIDFPVGPDDKSSGLAGEVNLCHTASLNKFCFYASRSVSGSGFGGTSRRSQAGVNIYQRLTETLTVTGGASYARSSVLNGSLPMREYVSGQLGLHNRFTKNLTVGIEGQYRDTFGAGFPIKADMGAEINATLALPGSK